MSISKSFCVILGLMFSLTTANGSFAGTQVIDGAVARNHLKRTVQTMLYQEKYDALEQMASDFRNNKVRFPEGSWKLQFFYESFSSPKTDSPEGWKRFLGKIDGWLRAHPDSVTARVAAGTAWTYFGWKARGSGYANTVTEEGWKLLRERISKAYEMLEKKPSRAEEDCPGRYDLLLTIAMAEGWQRPKFEALFHDAVAFEPAYHPFYVRKAAYLLPKWHGEEGEWQRFAEETIKSAPQAEAKSIYKSILWGMWSGKDFTSFDEPGISWPLMKQGFLETEQRFPNSPWNLNNFCKYACVAGDRETARELFKRIGGHPYIEAWKNSDEYAKWRRWAGIENDQTKKPSFPEGTEDFRQTLQVAVKGDAEAQYQTGFYYERGEQIAKNYDDAANWFRKAAEQGHPEAQNALGMLYYNGFWLGRKEVKEAMKWYLLSAIHGNENGASLLGHCYYAGVGVEKNLVNAYAWLSQITRYKDQRLAEIAGKLSPDQLQQAEKEAKRLREEVQANKALAESR